MSNMRNSMLEMQRKFVSFLKCVLKLIVLANDSCLKYYSESPDKKKVTNLKQIVRSFLFLRLYHGYNSLGCR